MGEGARRADEGPAELLPVRSVPPLPASGHPPPKGREFTDHFFFFFTPSRSSFIFFVSALSASSSVRRAATSFAGPPPFRSSRIVSRDARVARPSRYGVDDSGPIRLRSPSTLAASNTP